MKIAFTGHRPQKLGGFDDNTNMCKQVMIAIHKAVSELPARPTLFISGMALGVDSWAAEYAIVASIPFAAYVPFLGQDGNWLPESKARYAYLLSKASEVKYVCTPGYAAWKMQERNKAMVDDCDILFAVWDGTSGGTANCVQYAQSKGKAIKRLVWNN